MDDASGSDKGGSGGDGDGCSGGDGDGCSGGDGDGVGWHSFGGKEVPEELTPYKVLTTSPIYPTQAGLNNRGNTCFMNALLQCLANVPMLMNLITSAHSITNLCRRHNQPANIFTHLESLFLEMHSTSQPITPNELLLELPEILPDRHPNQQADAHDYMIGLFQILQKSCMDVATKVYLFGDEFLTQHPRWPRTTPIHQIFGGEWKSTVVCGACHSVSDSIEPFLTTSVEICGKSSVDECLTSFYGEETLDGDTAYSCSKCRALTKATKRLSIHTQPEVLVVHLKRFAMTKDSSGNLVTSKDSSHINFHETIDINPHLSQTRRGGFNTNYKLSSVLVHEGRSKHHGHYYMYTLCGKTGARRMDDSYINRVTASDVRTQQAYMLFYTSTTPSKASLTKVFHSHTSAMQKEHEL